MWRAKKGDEVEVMGFEPGFDCSWSVGIVTKDIVVHDGDNKSSCNIKFPHFVVDEQSKTPLVQAVPCRFLRPKFPLSDSHLLNFKTHDEVDVMVDDVWWEAQLLSRLTNAKIRVCCHGSNEELVVSHTAVRLGLVFNPPTNTWSLRPSRPGTNSLTTSFLPTTTATTTTTTTTATTTTAPSASTTTITSNNSLHHNNNSTPTPTRTPPANNFSTNNNNNNATTNTTNSSINGTNAIKDEEDVIPTGAFIEIAGNESGFEHSWSRGKALEPITFDHSYKPRVRFQNFKDEHTNRLIEICYPIEKLRPAYPNHFPSPAIENGLEVDAKINGVWWEGRITNVRRTGKCDVILHGNSEPVSDIPRACLRLGLDFDPESWEWGVRKTPHNSNNNTTTSGNNNTNNTNNNISSAATTPISPTKPGVKTEPKPSPGTPKHDTAKLLGVTPPSTLGKNRSSATKQRKISTPTTQHLPAVTIFPPQHHHHQPLPPLQHQHHLPQLHHQPYQQQQQQQQSSDDNNSDNDSQTSKPGTGLNTEMQNRLRFLLRFLSSHLDPPIRSHHHHHHHNEHTTPSQFSSGSEFLVTEAVLQKFQCFPHKNEDDLMRRARECFRIFVNSSSQPIADVNALAPILEAFSLQRCARCGLSYRPAENQEGSCSMLHDFNRAVCCWRGKGTNSNWSQWRLPCCGAPYMCNLPNDSIPVEGSMRFEHCFVGQHTTRDEHKDSPADQNVVDPDLLMEFGLL